MEDRYSRYKMPTPSGHRGFWFHVFITGTDDNGKPKSGYLGPYQSESQAEQMGIGASGVNGDFVIHRSLHRDSQKAKQEWRHLKFSSGGGSLWDTLKPIRNIRRDESNE